MVSSAVCRPLSKTALPKYSHRNTVRVSNVLEPDWVRHSVVGPSPGPNRSQRPPTDGINCTSKEIATVPPAKSDSDFMPCPQSYQRLIIDGPLVYQSYPQARINTLMIQSINLRSTMDNNTLEKADTQTKATV